MDNYLPIPGMGVSWLAQTPKKTQKDPKPISLSPLLTVLQAAATSAEVSLTTVLLVVALLLAARLRSVPLSVFVRPAVVGSIFVLLLVSIVKWCCCRALLAGVEPPLAATSLDLLVVVAALFWFAAVTSSV